MTSNSSGRRVSWSKVDGAAGYEVFRKADGGSWAAIGTTTSCAYTDTAKLSSGKTYRYTVRAYRGSLSTAKANKYDARYWGHYDTEGAPALYLAAPSMTGTQKTGSGLKSSWTKVAGATGYEVYRKSSGGSWTPIATTVWTNYTDTTARDMTTYYYTVRPYKGDASTAKSHKYDASYWGGYSSSGWTVYNGFQNPAGYYQVSCYSVSIKNQGKNQFGYRTPSQIAPDASKLECVNAMVTRAYDYLGTPYRWDYSCAPGVGVDCSGLVMQALYACGMNLSPMNPWEHYYLGMTGGSHSAYANYMWNSGKFQKLSFSKRQRGDIVSWNGHVAIYLGNNQIIEANGRDVHIASVYAYGTPRGVLRPFIE